MASIESLLYEISVLKKYELIDQLVKHYQVQHFVDRLAKRYYSSRHSKHQKKTLIISLIKELLMSKYRYQPEYTEGKFFSFLKKSLGYEIVKNFKLESPYQEYPTQTLDYDHSSESEYLEDTICERIDLKNALKILPLVQQQILYGYYVEGYTIRELAGQLGISKSSVWRLKNRAIQNLVIILEKGGTNGSQNPTICTEG